MNQILIWAQLGAVPTTPTEMVVHGTMATKIVLGVLVVLSLLSWAIMFAKWRQFRSISRDTDDFMHNFERSSSFEGVVEAVRQSGDVPHARLLRRASDFLRQVTPALAATPGRAQPVDRTAWHRARRYRGFYWDRLARLG